MSYNENNRSRVVERNFRQPKTINTICSIKKHHGEYMREIHIGRLEITIQLHRKKDKKGLEKLFALCDRLEGKNQ